MPPSTSARMLALSLDSHDAAAHRSQADVNPVQDHRFVYARDPADPGGHL